MILVFLTANRNVWSSDLSDEYMTLNMGVLHLFERFPFICGLFKKVLSISAGHVARLWDRRSTYRILVEKPEVRKPLGRRRYRWENSIKMYRREVGWGMDWIDLVQDRDTSQDVVNVVMNIRVP
jgi:hypothetical protein